jgi:hypothetical protein
MSGGLEQLRAFCRARLADLKVPKETRIVSAIPGNELGTDGSECRYDVVTGVVDFARAVSTGSANSNVMPGPSLGRAQSFPP